MPNPSFQILQHCKTS